jgi:hypothetical protein
MLVPRCSNNKEVYFSRLFTVHVGRNLEGRMIWVPCTTIKHRYNAVNIYNSWHRYEEPY